ncbi:peroxiredoxin-like family protein [Limnoglobus roseus]|uniref:Thiol-disulfide oxidoreductase ResA n=1 Tax=Limnoglobus roseus TaxID=2598579 RepID=A0A5C1ALT9_9BACT|nr:peroxiredoxin-like family protein [Limnoglobus roseus]QEL18134.1 Thiol-disulfide oxidoreductase ResA [Limnoglobus roseus]
MTTGNTVPDFSFQRPDGSTVALSELLHADCTYLLFMRHFACMPCVVQVKEISRNYERLQEAGIHVLGVGHAPPPVVTQFLERNPIPFPVVTDVSRESYKAMGLPRVPLRHFLRPRILLDFFRLLFKGEKILRLTHTEDIQQLGGDYLIGRDRKILYVYPSRDATDRVSVETLLRWQAEHLPIATAAAR